MCLIFEFTIRETPPMKVAKRKVKLATRVGLAAGVRHWHRKILRRHFKNFSGAKYRHQKRRPKYRARKKYFASQGEAKMSGTVDNVYSGVMMRAMLRAHAVRSFPTRARIRMPGPTYATMTPRDPRRPSMGKEITTTIASEERDIGRVIERAITREIFNLRISKVKRIS